jgi:signal transduction histidine kinase
VRTARAPGGVRRSLPWLTPLVLGLVLSGTSALDARDHARSHADSALRADVAAAVTQVSSGVRAQVTQAGLTSGVTGTTVPASAVGTLGVSLDTAVSARDSGVPTLDDVATPPAIVVPVYATAQPPGTTAQRRTSITAYQVVPLVLGPLLAGNLPDDGGLVVHGPSRVVAAEPRAAPHGVRSFTVPLDLGDTSGWSLQGWRRVPAVSGGTWLRLIGLLLAFVGLAALVFGLQRRVAGATARQRQLERDSALVSGLAPVVQASLDLGEVIPAVSAHLAQGLDLAGLSLSVPGATGDRQLFAWGMTPDRDVLPVATPPARLEPGSTFAVSLARGGRVLGILRVLAGVPLSRHDLQALATASELLGSTLANAEAFSQQQTVVERMQSVDELKTVFLATASHELRTPVTAIVGFSTLVLEQWGQGDPEQARAFLERVVANARALEALTEQLLDFSRLERGIRPATGELLDLGGTTSRILTEHPELTADHRLVLRVDDGCRMHGSTPAVERIVTNLVGNAAKYSPPGTAITVSVHLDGDRVELLVDDEGPGVPERDRERVFSRFYRGQGDGVSRTRGAGVGLAVVAEFAASMSGAAAVRQAPSGGARFCVSFPAAGVLSGVESEGASHVRLA